MKAQLLFDPGVFLGEGPIWNDKKGVLTWVDILGKSFHVFNSITGKKQTYFTPQMVSFAVFSGKDSFLIALEDGLYRFSGDKISLIKELPGFNGKIRFNDGAYDKRGRLYIGTMGLHEDDQLNQGAASLYCFENGELRPVIDQVTISNGIAFDYQRKRFYYIDTPTRKVDVFDYDEESGDISNRRVFASFKEGKGFPDGMTIDSYGNIYVALWQGGGIRILNPQGDIIGFIEVDEDNVTSVEFGQLTIPFVDDSKKGLENEDSEPVLYITTAKNQNNKGGGLYYFPLKELTF